jgi:hypothetical protein
MKEFDKLYRELMETIWMPSTTIDIGIERKKEDSGFCEFNPKINKFALENPDQMALVFAFVYFTIQTDWNLVVENFPKFIEWFYTMAVKRSGGRLVADRSVTPPGLKHMMVSPSKKNNGLASNRLNYFYDVFDNRHKIYNDITRFSDDPREMFIYILKNINGLALVKTGFLVQLITGRIGCMDSINSKMYGKQVDFNTSKAPSVTKSGEYSKQSMEKIDKYINFVDPISKILWDDWCEIVENKFHYAIFKPKKEIRDKDEHKVIATRGKDGDIINQTSYILNKHKGNADSIARHQERIGKNRGKVISKDHFDILDNLKQYIKKESAEEIEGEFYKLYKELKESYDESPFAVFVVYQYPDGKIAATTRPKDRMGDDNGVSYGLPGGKVDPGEDPMDAAIRESEEEGWIVSGLTHKHSATVQGKMVWWYRATNAKPLQEYKEKYRGIKPVKINPQKLKGFGNEIAILKTLNESYEEDFDSKWQNAVGSSEELRVALDLMKNIKSKNSGDIYIVGGVPRDLLMGNEIDDVDMATNIPFENIAKDFDIRNISKNDSQPVYTILWKGYNFDLAKFREDSGDVGRQNNISTETVYARREA